ncbi:acid protease [Lojkania enalia]|uniref:Acid protease n=1 Tax=Lojkania enalia TaxID=147567 RepID=A0A9P4K8D9_9PLEO|nr:acid protease [Didymosphaeria enalia]
MILFSIFLVAATFASGVASPTQNEEFVQRTNYYKNPIEASQTPPGILDKGPFRLPIEDAAIFMYAVHVFMGTPPQIFKMALDLQWNTLFIPSTDCEDYVCEHHMHFDASASSTYVPSRESLELAYEGVIFDGWIAQDTLNIGGLAVANQSFLEVKHARSIGFLNWYNDYDGALGLAPPYTNNLPHVPSAWQGIAASGALNRKIFSIVLPQGKRYPLSEPRTNGELILGDVPDNFDEENSIHLPLQFAPYHWGVSLESLSFGDIHHNFVNASAYFSSTTPAVVLPKPFIDEILSKINVNITMLWPWVGIPCEARDELPDFTIGIGGQKITLDAYQYTFVVHIPPHDDMGDGDTGDYDACRAGVWRGEDNDVELGFPFWENFRTVFDLEERVILLEPVNMESKRMEERSSVVVVVVVGIAVSLIALFTSAWGSWLILSCIRKRRSHTGYEPVTEPLERQIGNYV